MKNRNFTRTSISSAVATAVLLAATPLAVTAAEDNFSLEEIVVTAQKREQSMQDVPVAVTAFSAADLQEAGIQTIADIERVTPNTQLRPSRATNTTLTAYIRGIGQNDPLWGFEPGVGLYIDDIYYARPQGAMLDVYDIERIEVLRGPQGSLYGKNTIGGAIKYVTKKLTGEPELGIDLGVGSYNQRDLTVSGQLPLIENTLNLGATVASFQRDGFGKNHTTGGENYDKDIEALRVTMEFTPTENLFMRLSGDVTQDDSNNRHGSRVIPSPDTGNPAHDPFDTYAGIGDDQEVKNSGGNFTLEWDLSDQLTFKSVSAYREGSTDGLIDFDATALNLMDVPVWYADHQFTQEFQLNYTTDQLALVGGVYYLDGYAAGAFDVILGKVFGAAEPRSAGTSFTALTMGTAETTSKAAYLHASFNLSSDVTLTAGGRYTKDEKSATVFKAKYMTDGSAGGASSEFGGTELGLLAIQSDFEEGDEWSQFSPKVGLDWHVSDEVMVYTSYAEGFKSGGINMRADVSASPAGFSHVFEPETAKSVELGVKAELLDNRVRLNAAAFHTKYDNVQITQTVVIGENFVPSVATNNTQLLTGVELELTGRLSENFTGVVNLGYIDAEWDKFTNGSGDEVGDQMTISNVPEFSGMVGVNYEVDLGDKGALVLGASVSYTSEIAMEVALGEQPIDEDSYSLVNLDATWYSADDRWTLSLHGKNLTDEEYRVAGYNFATDLFGQSVTGFYGAPRTVSLNLGYTF